MFLSDTVVNHLREVASEPDLSGTRYELVRKIGQGGMGAVYLARDKELDREVALKVSSGQLAARLTREAKFIAQLEHPGIVPVHDGGTLPDGRVFYVMKLVRGERLDVWAKGRELRERLRMFRRVCEAVAFAHSHQVLHRDLKPENVMVGAFGEALVMDWGLARVMIAKDDLALSPTLSPAGERGTVGTVATLAGAVLGTPAYMAPEQARGDHAAIGLRSDVYGLGATASELGDDVGRYLEQEPVRAHPETLLERLGRFAARNSVVLGLIGVYLLVRLLMLFLPG